ncbi:MAG: 50S ribosomal protein L37ae [Thermoplasmata archaeon]
MSRRTKKVGIAGRFGPRYGVAPKKQWKDIMELRIQYYECPSCGHRTLRRVSTSIWECRRCGYTFAGGAYIPFVKKEISKEGENVKL